MASLLSSFTSSIYPFSKLDYKFLFEASQKGGFPLCHEKTQKWTIHHCEPKGDRVGYYTEIVCYLITTKCYQEIPNLEAFVKRFNICLTSSVCKSPSSSKAVSIFFNSKSAEYQFLSNFYPTLVIFPDHNPPNKSRIYPSAENVYQAHKVAQILEQQKKEDAQEVDAAENWESILEEIATASPLEAKQLAVIYVTGESSDKLPQMKYELMKRVTIAKFQCNPVISKYLTETAPKELVEDSSDRFWGSKDPADPSLKPSYRLPISKSSRNVLGRILMEVRGSKPVQKPLNSAFDGG